MSHATCGAYTKTPFIVHMKCQRDLVIVCELVTLIRRACAFDRCENKLSRNKKVREHSQKNRMVEAQ